MTGSNLEVMTGSLEVARSNSKHADDMLEERSGSEGTGRDHRSQMSVHLRRRCLHSQKTVSDQYREQQDKQDRWIRKFRWRMLSRILVYFIRWERLKNLGKDRGFVMRRMVAGRVQERVFNVDHFSKIVKQHQVLTTHAKLLVYKEPVKRTNQDIVVILGYFNRMKCFSKYSVSTKRQLASKVRYSCYPKGEVIFTEGSYPLYFYLVLSGGVQLYSTFHPENPEDSTLKPIGSPIKEGMGFGELGIVNNKKRLATVITTHHSEFFSLDKEEYVKLLQEYHDEERTMKFNLIRQIPEIDGVPEDDIRKAIDASYIKNFARGEIIINGEDHDRMRKKCKEALSSVTLDSYLSVIVSGSAVLEKQIQVCQQILPSGITMVTFPNESRRGALVDFPPKLRPTIHHEPLCMRPKYLSVKTYIPGDVFTPIMYESEYVIGAKEATTILYIPKAPFMIHKLGEPMLQLFDRLSTTKITVTALLREYNATRVWRDYKRQLVRQILLDKSLRRSNLLG